MSKITNVIIVLSLWWVTTTCFAYRIYNQMDNDDCYYSREIYVVDNYGFRGIKTHIRNGQSAACAPHASGCSGTLHFQVMDVYDYDILCTGDFHIDNNPGHYFIVRTNHADGAICTITHYQN